ncbi:hypothetical protein CC1G_09439 [Coprinopsis cinerea okayama7|uniref:Uncharacterized protein n=1 Tax=Coprinopsis cinerea (strain Okayama-7 / 130 / ATCC MYA-4618 / FGSC 9003) TaxID=240176 RepID=A8NIL6_COPC7|nr:hypothetical protein CC1G_09439 [Coprinopsis cinerea okayama7\|eukprot:XP_001834025.1 hypothetical protein CC1G_09439 [Coprinopsis cinerea okayama7\
MSTAPVHLIFDNAPNAIEFNPPEAWTEEVVNIDRQEYGNIWGGNNANKPYVLGMHQTRPPFRPDNQTAEVRVVFSEGAANSSIELYGRSYTTTSSGISAENLAITYQPTDQQPDVAFSQDAFLAINFGVVAAKEDANLNGSRIIVDDVDTSQLLYFGDWREDSGDEFAEREDLADANAARVRVGPRISYRGTRHTASTVGSGFRFRYYGSSIEMHGCVHLTRPGALMEVRWSVEDPGEEPTEAYGIHREFDPERDGSNTTHCETKFLRSTHSEEPVEKIITMNIVNSPDPSSASFSFDYLVYNPGFESLSDKPEWDIEQLEPGYSWNRTSKGTIIGASVGGSLGFLLIVGLIIFWFLRRRRRQNAQIRGKASG